MMLKLMFILLISQAGFAAVGQEGAAEGLLDHSLPSYGSLRSYGSAAPPLPSYQSVYDSPPPPYQVTVEDAGQVFVEAIDEPQPIGPYSRSLLVRVGLVSTLIGAGCGAAFLGPAGIGIIFVGKVAGGAAGVITPIVGGMGAGALIGAFAGTSGNCCSLVWMRRALHAATGRRSN